MNIITKLFVAFIVLIGLMGTAFANTGPASLERQGTISFDPDSVLAKNVSVEKELLFFRVNSENTAVVNPKYPGYDYVADKLRSQGHSEDYIADHTLDYAGDINTVAKPFILYKLPDNYMFQDHTGSVEATVQYTLKNTSDITINGAEVVFSSLVNEKYNDFFVNDPLSYTSNKCNHTDGACSGFIDNLYMFYPENAYPQNVSAVLAGKKLDINETYMIDNLSAIYPNASAKNIYLVKKVNSFHLSFLPHETKKLTIRYNIPLQLGGYILGGLINYDFSPIFGWKDGSVKEVNIAIIGDNEHILNTEFSYFYDAQDGSEGKTTQIDFKHPKKDVYIARLDSVTKKQGLNGLRLQFNNRADILSGNFCGAVSLNNNFFCGENGILQNIYNADGSVQSYPAYSGARLSEDPEKVVIDFTGGHSEEHRVFDMFLPEAESVFIKQARSSKPNIPQYISGSINPDYIELLYNKCQFNEVVKIGEEYLKTRPNDIKVLKMMYRSYFIINNLEKSLEILDKMDRVTGFDLRTNFIACDRERIYKMYIKDQPVSYAQSIRQEEYHKQCQSAEAIYNNR